MLFGWEHSNWSDCRFFFLWTLIVMYTPGKLLDHILVANIPSCWRLNPCTPDLEKDSLQPHHQTAWWWGGRVHTKTYNHLHICLPKKIKASFFKFYYYACEEIILFYSNRFSNLSFQKNEVFVDTKTAPIIKKIVRPYDLQDAFESRK